MFGTNQMVSWTLLELIRAAAVCSNLMGRTSIISRHHCHHELVGQSVVRDVQLTSVFAYCRQMRTMKSICKSSGRLLKQVNHVRSISVETEAISCGPGICNGCGMFSMRWFVSMLAYVVGFVFLETSFVFTLSLP